MQKIKKLNQIKLGAILSYVSIAANILVKLIYTPFLIRNLGQSEYGLFSLVSSLIASFTILDLGFGNAIIYYTVKYKENGKKDEEEKLHGMFVIIYCIIGFIAVVLGCILYANVQNIFSNSVTEIELQKAKKLIMILIINLAISFPFSVFSSIITAYEKFIFIKIVNIIRIVLTPVVIIPFLIIGFKSVAITIIISVLNIASLVANMIYCKCRLKIKFRFGKLDFKIFKNVSSYSIWIFLNIIINKLNWNIDQYIIGAIAGTAAVSVYSIGAQMNTLYLNFSTAISSVLLPKAIKMEEKEASKEEYTNLFIKIGKIQLGILGLILTGFILFGKVFIQFWAGPEYKDSYIIACILMIPITIPLLQSVGETILQAKNKNKFRTIILFVIAILNVCISIPLVKRFGGIGSSIGTAIAVVMGQILIMNIYYKKSIGLNIIKFYKEMFKVLVPILFIFVLGYLYVSKFNIRNIFIFGIGIFLYTLIYAVLVGKIFFKDFF